MGEKEGENVLLPIHIRMECMYRIVQYLTRTLKILADSTHAFDFQLFAKCKQALFLFVSGLCPGMVSQMARWELKSYRSNSFIEGL